MSKSEENFKGNRTVQKLKNLPTIVGGIGKNFVSEILLDITSTFTYHTRACARGLAAQTAEIVRGSRPNRGADSHYDE